MNSKILMIISSIVLGILGIGLSFMPDEILGLLRINGSSTTPLILQVTGALYLGFSILNWMAKGNIIGGVYSRPVSMGNFVHFFVGGIALIKFIFINQGLSVLWIIAIPYVVLALWFGIILFSHPEKTN